MADTTDIIKCPACDKVMKKLYIQEDDLHIDICLDGCGGIFFDNRELEKFDEKHENADKILEAIEGKKFVQVNDVELRICPACGLPMVKMGAADGTVQIDVCNTCGGKFLDNGELQKIRKYKNDHQKVDNIIDGIMKTVYSDIKPNKRRMFFEKLVSKYV